MKTLRILLLIGWWLVTTVVYGQSTKPNDIRLQSPNAASLGIFGEIPMNLSAGMANYSIPLYQIQSGSLQWPISLHYTYTGYRPNEEAGWVGRGWSLAAGGVITRAVKGYADEDQFINVGNTRVEGYMKSIDKINTIYNTTSTTSNIGGDYQQLLRGTMDGEPDLFNVSCGKLNGKFYFGYMTENGVTVKKFQFVTNRKVKIETTSGFEQNGSGQGGIPVISSFVITDEDGTKYEFSQKEWSYQKTLLPIKEETTEYDYVVTAWHITKITSQTGDVIAFNYIPQNSAFDKRRSQLHRQDVLYVTPELSFSLNCYGSTAVVKGAVPADGKARTLVNYATEAILSSIESRQVTATFSSTSRQRSSLLSANETSSISLKSDYSFLEQLQVKNVQGQVVKNWRFKYKWPDDVNADLFLKSVQETANDLSEGLPPYLFSYDNEDNILLKNNQRLYITTLGVDRWGYYNGYENAKGMGDGTLLPSGGAFRGSVADKARWGALTKVVFPTGGMTCFSYESNEFSKITEIAPGNENFQYITPEEYAITFQNGQWLNNVSITVPFSSSYTYTYSCGNYTNSTQPSSICNYITTQGLSTGTYAGVFVPNQTYTRTEILPASLLSYINSQVTNNPSGVANTALIIKIKLLRNTSIVREPGSGVRIKKIETYSAENKLVNTKEFAYNDPSNSAKSSGQIYRRPNQELKNFNIGLDISNVSMCGIETSPPVLIPILSYQNSDQVAPTISYGNNFVLYDYVEELENGTQLKKHYFSTFPEYQRTNLTCITCPSPVLVGNLLSYLFPAPVLDFAIGLLKKTESFAGDNASNRKLVHSKSTTYSRLSDLMGSNTLFSPAIAVANLAYYSYPVCNCNYTSTSDKVIFITPPMISATKYNVYSYAFNTKASSETIIASNSTDAVVTDETYTYSPDHYLLQSVSKNRSDGTTLREDYRYPLDYGPKYVSDASRASWLTKMITNNYVSPIIETRTYLTRGSTTNIVNANLTTYKEVGTSVLPANSYVFKSLAPVSTMTFYNGQTFSLANYPNYRETISYDSYDSYGNLLQATPKDGVPTSYLWAYKGNFPVAVVKNATYASVSASLSANFNNLTDSPSIKTALGQVRSSLTSALVESALYTPSVGVSEKINPAGLSTYYEYDKFNRLSLIKNTQGDQVKKYEYSYRLQFGVGNPIADQTLFVNRTASYAIPAEAFTNPANLALSYTIQGLPAGLSATGLTISGTPSTTGTYTVTVRATNPGSEAVQTSFKISVLSSVPPITILQPLRDCSTGLTTFRYSGGDGSEVEYWGLLVTPWTSSTSTFTYNPYSTDGLVTLQARQKNNPTATTVTYLWDWKTPCQATNQPPQLTQTVPSQTISVGANFTVSVVSLFSDPENQDMGFTVTGLPAGLQFNGQTISGAPSASGVSTITLKATDLYSATATTSFTLTVKPATPIALSLMPPSYTCNSGRFIFNIAGGNGSAVEYTAVGITGWTTTAGPYTVSPAQDAQPYTLYARQSGTVVSYTWDWKAMCQTQNTPPVSNTLVSIPSQTAVAGSTFTYTLPTNLFTDRDNQPLTYTIMGLPSGLSFNGSVISGVTNTTGLFSITVVATDSYNATASRTFSLSVSGSPVNSTTFAMLTPVYNCSSGSFTFQSTVGNGTTIEFMSIGITGWTTTAGSYSVNPACDAQPFTLYARQSGVTISYTWNWKAQCPGKCPNRVISAAQKSKKPLQFKLRAAFSGDDYFCTRRSTTLTGGDIPGKCFLNQWYFWEFKYVRGRKLVGGAKNPTCWVVPTLSLVSPSRYGYAG